MVKWVLVILIVMPTYAMAQSRGKLPTLGATPDNKITRSENSDDSLLVRMAFEAKQVVPFIDWGSWDYEQIYGTLENGVIRKSHPWNVLCRGYQPIHDGRPRDVYVTCNGYCYYGAPVPFRGHPLLIFRLRRECTEFDIFEQSYGRPTKTK